MLRISEKLFTVKVVVRHARLLLANTYAVSVMGGGTKYHNGDGYGSLCRFNTVEFANLYHFDRHETPTLALAVWSPEP